MKSFSPQIRLNFRLAECRVAMPDLIHHDAYIVGLHHEGKGCCALTLALVPLNASQYGLADRGLLQESNWGNPVTSSGR